jgi:hypothetical protein
MIDHSFYGYAQGRLIDTECGIIVYKATEGIVPVAGSELSGFNEVHAQTRKDGRGLHPLDRWIHVRNGIVEPACEYKLLLRKLSKQQS